MSHFRKIIWKHPHMPHATCLAPDERLRPRLPLSGAKPEMPRMGRKKLTRDQSTRLTGLQTCLAQISEKCHRTRRLQPLNWNHMLSSESSKHNFTLVHVMKQLVVTVAVVTVCGSYET